MSESVKSDNWSHWSQLTSVFLLNHRAILSILSFPFRLQWQMVLAFTYNRCLHVTNVKKEIDADTKGRVYWERGWRLEIGGWEWEVIWETGSPGSVLNLRDQNVACVRNYCKRTNVKTFEDISLSVFLYIVYVTNIVSRLLLIVFFITVRCPLNCLIKEIFFNRSIAKLFFSFGLKEYQFIWRINA